MGMLHWRRSIDRKSVIINSRDVEIEIAVCLYETSEGSGKKETDIREGWIHTDSEIRKEGKNEDDRQGQQLAVGSSLQGKFCRINDARATRYDEYSFFSFRSAHFIKYILYSAHFQFFYYFFFFFCILEASSRLHGPSSFKSGQIYNSFFKA